MSCNYAEGLSEYENKGVIGVPEVFNDAETVAQKCELLAEMISKAKHVVVHTGAGISTASGIPDFRGPNGVWTLEKRGEKPSFDVSFEEAVPTKTHMGLKALLDAGLIQFIVSQNIDGLHLRSGISRSNLSELHGNMFLEKCTKCRKNYVRSSPAPTVGQKCTGALCRGGNGSRPCRKGQLIDTILDWEDGLPEKDLDLALMHSTIADLNICLGTTLQIVPSGNLPLKNKKFGGQLVICNLQPTKHNSKADLIISTYVDDIIERVLKRLGVEIPEYARENDPTKQLFCDKNWSVTAAEFAAIEKQYSTKVKNHKRKSLTITATDDSTDEKKIKVKKEESVDEPIEVK